MTEIKKTEEPNKDGEETYRSLIVASPDSLVVIDLDGKIKYINESLAKSIGATAQELRGTSFSDYFTEPEKARQAYKNVFEKGSVLDSPLTVRNRDGKHTEVLFSGSVYKDNGDNILGVIFVVKNSALQKGEENKLTGEKKSELNNIKVLVAEDVILNQLLMKAMIKEFGFETELASNGKIAIEKLEKNNYDIVLMDLQMPEMNGFEAAEHIRTKMHSSIPIIALTANATALDVEKCKSVGMNDYVEKPIDEKVLHAKMMRYLNSKAPQKDYRLIENGEESDKKAAKYSNLDYLKQRTKGNQDMVSEMIETYLHETPELIRKMKESVDNIDWESLAGAAHSLIPSFRIIGMNKDYEDMARRIQEYAAKREKSSEINDLVLKLEQACIQAAQELSDELKKMKQFSH